MHFHGLRLDSEMDGAANHNDVVRPGESFDYRFVPRDPGVYWYHPHVRSDEQIERGLYGVLVVRDRPSADGERILVVDDVDLEPDGEIAEATKGDLKSGRRGEIVTVNGALRPTIWVSPGSRERWTFVNAANARHLSLTLDGARFEVVGGDTGTLPAFQVREELLVVPGERWTVDVELDGDPGTIATLWSHPFSSGHEMDGDEAVPLLDVRFVAGDATRVPELEPTPIEPLDTSAATTRALELTARFDDPLQPRFYINGEAWPFNTIAMGTPGNVEIWQIDNREPAEHPFHLHGMFFQVLDASGAPDPTVGWKDTVRIPPNGSVRFAVMLEPGHWMFHCQIPEHAERGMMGEIHVEP
jgi:FtsP/CotA-like multicopper oxidase with cupredoxin domain